MNMKVMISSTSRDLPEHRRKVVEACLRQDVQPIDMQYLPAREITPVAVDQEVVGAADARIRDCGGRYPVLFSIGRYRMTHCSLDRTWEAT